MGLPLLIGAGCLSASIYSFNYENCPPACVCIGSLCSQGWQFSKPDLHALLKTNFCPCHKLAYLRQGSEKWWTGFTVWQTCRFVSLTKVSPSLVFLICLCCIIHLLVLISVMNLISELCRTPLHMAAWYPIFMFHPLHLITVSVRFLWEHWCHWSADMIRVCGVLTSHSHKTHSWGCSSCLSVVCRQWKLMNEGVEARQTEKSHSRLLLFLVFLTEVKSDRCRL